ncbi:DUF6414 family protein [Amycolatopsis sp. 3B14]|uniref:DUF6414 family protein n=1 Tax=Amycolatopsis sp. 3B14 TaxID=3243600 RepID=UPI003D95E1E8
MNWWKFGRDERRDIARLEKLRQLREFIYLDEVSVTSLFASREGKVPHEFTDSATAGVKAEVNGQVEAGIAAVGKARIGSKYESSRSVNSQVVSKATIQTLFKNLYDSEKKSFVIATPKSISSSPPRRERLMEMLSGSRKADPRWVIPLTDLRRGELAELNVELEADPIFQFGTILSSFEELTDESEELRASLSGPIFDQMLDFNRVFDKLMVGLIPIKCRVVDWSAVNFEDRSYIIRQSAAASLLADVGSNLSIEPLYLVADTEQDLFWKDVRRVLFSAARFTVLCRLNGEGLIPEWNPVRLSNALELVSPAFGKQMQGFSKNISKAAEMAQFQHDDSSNRRILAVVSYAQEISRGTGLVLNELDLFEIRTIARENYAKLTSVIDARAVFSAVKELVERKAGIVIDNERDAAARSQVYDEYGPLVGADVAVKVDFVTTGTEPDAAESLLEVSVVAMYW